MEQSLPAVLPVPKHPEIDVQRLSLILMTCLCVGTIVVGVISLRLSLSSARDLKFPLWIFFGESGLCDAFFVVRGYRRLHALQGIERQRVASIHETSVRIDSIEFASQKEISPLPSAITVIPQKADVWRDMLYLSLFILFLCILPFIDLLVGAGFFVTLIIMLILVVFFSFIITYVALSFLKAEITIEARERDLYVMKRGDRVLKEHIDWDEARLFACYTLPNLLPWEKTQYYELSSSTHVVTWISVSEKRSPFTRWKPVLPAQEYRLQIQVLCEVITAKTGLALCDLTRSREDT